MPRFDYDPENNLYIEYEIGDCLELMKGMADNSVDLVLTDPPYGIGESSKNHKSRGMYPFGGKSNANKKQLAIAIDYGKYDWDSKIPSKEVFDEMFRISKNQIIFGGNYFIEYLHNSSCWIVWDKDNGNCDFADCELAWTSFDTAVRYFKFRWHGMLQEDMKRKEKRYHPTQKPVPLFEWILNKYSNPGDTILDPFLGSGTTLLACRNTGRIGKGFEISKDYESIIKKRIMADQKSLKHFF